MPSLAFGADGQQSEQLSPLHEDYVPPSPAEDVRIEIIGDARTFAVNNPFSRDFLRRSGLMAKGSTCGQGNNCALRPSEDVVLSVFIPTSRNWSFSLCGSSFDTYMAIGTTPCSANLGFNDDFCGRQSQSECIYLDVGVVYVTIESGSGGCGTYKLIVDTCSAGRCCYMDSNNEPACTNSGYTECAAVSGEWDASTRCETDPCPLGRCCYEIDGVPNCMDGLLEKECLFNLQGTWTEGVTCSQEICPEMVDTLTCGPLDLVLAIDVSGSMIEELSTVQSEAQEILTRAVEVSREDLRVGLVTFREFVSVPSSLTNDIGSVSSAIGQLFAYWGGDPGEASDEALREIITMDGSCTHGPGFDTPFRAGADKVIIIMTDEINSGCSGIFRPQYAHQRALDAQAADIRISSIYIRGELNERNISDVLRDYAETTGGLYVVSRAGENISENIEYILDRCGRSTLALAGDSIPNVPCVNSTDFPNQVELKIRVRNVTNEPIGGGTVHLFSDAGPGGTGLVISPNPVSLGYVLPHDTVEVGFTVVLAANPSGGCINFRAVLTQDTIELGTDSICINVPNGGLEFGNHWFPAVHCDGYGVAPTSFTATFDVVNNSLCEVDDAQVSLEILSGSGGQGTVVSANPVQLGHVPYGRTVTVPFDVQIQPLPPGGCIYFRAMLHFGDEPYQVQESCLNIPSYELTLLAISDYAVSCVDGEIVPLSMNLVVAARNSSSCPAHGVQIWMGPGNGSAGTGTVVTQNPVVIGTMNLLSTRGANFGVEINPNSTGGIISFPVKLIVGTDTVATSNANIIVPPCGCESTTAVVMSSKSESLGCTCVQMCDTAPIPITICGDGYETPSPPVISFQDCFGDCVQGEAAVPESLWIHENDCWTNFIHVVVTGCTQVCAEFPRHLAAADFKLIRDFDRIYVRWNMVSEKNLKLLEVERNGQMVAVVDATNEVGSEYEWTDSNVRPGASYEYRLFATDLEGMRGELGFAVASPLDEPSIVSGFALLPNYPNPFNGSTTIEFDLPEASDVQLVVYDISGRKVTELAHGSFASGRHAVVFGGEELASGLYLCHMTAGKFSTRQKMLLLK
ncbi:MAG: VWA domain-containing protein [Calditrichaeota bacterium]|nr:VWA domain-containing protein [Calditrichota bacterium]MCB9369806.1 VWA domain-containing protein [Calditrichota bacterium]